MKPNLIIKKFPKKVKFIINPSKLTQTNSVVPIKYMDTYIQLFLFLLIIFTIYILYIKNKTKLTKNQKRKQILKLYNQVYNFK